MFALAFGNEVKRVVRFCFENPRLSVYLMSVRRTVNKKAHELLKHVQYVQYSHMYDVSKYET
jgi:hypothetical protein